MKQINIGSSALPAAPKSSRSGKPRGFSKSWMLLSSVFILSLQLFAGNAGAQTVTLPATLTSTQNSLTATNVCNPAVPAKFASGWQAGTGYWEYTLNTTGYTGITMSYSTSSSATGPNKGTVYYNVGGFDSLLTTYSWTFANTACHQGTITLPVSCNGIANLKVKIVMSGVGGTVGSSGTNRIDTGGIFTASGTACSPGSLTAGTVSASPAAICSGTGTTLTLTGATGGAGITYQWQDSVVGGTWTNVGTSSLILNTGILTVTSTGNVYYRAETKCGVGTVTSPVATVTVNALPANLRITNTLGGNPLIVDSITVLTAPTAGGSWTNGNPSVLTDVNNANHDTLTGVFGGTAIMSYQTFDPATGCTNTQLDTVNVAWPNTLALYAGDHGTSTNVINVTGDTARTLTQTGFSIGTPCSTGGFSGMQLPVADSLFSNAGPHISYVIKPVSGQALNVFRIHATTRQSGSGASRARIAYRVGGGAWIDENRDVAQSSGGCGTSPNSWDFGTPTGGLTITGIVDSIEVAVFPYKPSAANGTFQLNTLEVYGVVTPNMHCGGLSGTSGTLTPAVTYICDSGSQFLSLDNGSSFTGITGVGITYEWDSSSTSPTSGFVAVTGPGKNTITYQAGNPKFHVGGTTPAVIYYRVIQKCDDATSAASANAVVNINHSPAKPTITGITNQQFITLSGASAITLSPTGHSGLNYYSWFSNDTSVLSVDSATAALTTNLMIAGDAIISLVDSNSGCFSVSKDTINVVQDNAIAAYIGKAGTSDTVTKLQPAVTTSILAQTGFGSNTPCDNGGLSGLTNNGSTVYIPDGSGAHAFYTLTPATNGLLELQSFHATLRSSASGIQLVQLAYNINNGAWIPDVDQAVDVDDCGYSTTDITYQSGLPPLGLNDFVTFGIYGYDPLAVNGTFQINSSSVTGCAFSPIIDVTNMNTPLDGQIFGNCPTPVVLSATPAGGTFSIDPASDPTFVHLSGNSFTVSGMASPADNEDVVIDYLAPSCTSIMTATIHLNFDHGCTGAKETGVTNVSKANDVNIYPNPTTNILHIASKDAVNVSILSMDGRKLMNQENATTLNVSALASGVYMIQVYSAADNSLVKTVQFTKE